MSQNAHILISGRDRVLLRTRGQVLEFAGYRVTTTLEPIERSGDLEDVQLFIICHTLTADERLNDIQCLASISPNARALCLIPHAGTEFEGATVLDSFRGPQEMLRVVNRLLTA